MRKNDDVQSALGIRFDVAVSGAARLAVERELGRAFATQPVWTVHASAARSYLRIATRGGEPDATALATRLGALAGGVAVASRPPAFAVDVVTDGPAASARLVAAFAGEASDVAVHARGVALEIERDRTTLAGLIARIDAATGPSRTIVPLRTVDDDALAAFAAVRLGDPALDASRLIETYVEPLLEADRA